MSLTMAKKEDTLLKNLLFDLMILDIMRPVFNGMTILREIRKRGVKTPYSDAYS